MSKKNELYQLAQESLVSALLYDGQSTNRVLEITSYEDFEDATLSVIMYAIVCVSRNDVKVDAVTVAEQLESTGELEQVGGMAALYKLRTEGEAALLKATPEIYASILRESSAKKKLLSIMDESKIRFKDDSGISAREGVSEVQSEITKEMLKLADEATITNVAPFMEEYLDILKERERISIENEGKSEGIQGIPTLLPSLNKYTSGFMGGQLITVAARTGVGKSVFAIMTAVAAARAGKSVLFFSLEMSRNEIVDRIVANMSGVSLSKIKQGRMTEDEEHLINGAARELSDMSIVIDTDPQATVDSIRSKSLRQSQSEDGLDIVILDYLQLLSSSSRSDNRQQQVAEFSRNMKLLAKSLSVPVMVLSQMNRARNGEEDENKAPTLDNIRESAAIAQDSDIVIILHRDVSIDNATPHTLVILEKNRGGEAHKTIRCYSNLECSNLREVPRASESNDKLTEEELADLEDDLDLEEYDFDDDLDLAGL